ncbi:MAG TPA: hypothetical protein ENN69_05925 [Spirochaetia bacterium]|nr:hypothetical protein [Spirochaetia bacterium]
MGIRSLEYAPDAPRARGEGFLKAVCDFSGAGGGAGYIGSNWDHEEDFTRKTVTFNLYIPEALKAGNYRIRFYLMSTPGFWNWVKDSSETFPIENSGWNRVSYRWDKAGLSGNAEKTREVGLIIEKSPDSPDWTGSIYFDDIGWKNE